MERLQRRLTESADRLAALVEAANTSVVHTGPGWTHAGKTTPDVNPYEQELWRYHDQYRLSREQLAAQLPEIAVRYEDLRRSDYVEFLERYVPDHGSIAKATDHKKKLEMYISFHHLRFGPSARFLDAAGGGFSYAGTVEAAERYLQDLEIRNSVKQRVGSATTYIEDSLSNIPLPDGSLDAISCHHAFEHFQGTADMDFIDEVQRVLAVGGRAAIVPLFLSIDHVEMTNLPTFDNWSGDDDAIRIIDTTATLPGKKSGNYARVYHPRAFRRRVLDRIDLRRFAVEIVEHTLEGAPVPDPKVYDRAKVSNFNFPYRALVIERLS